MVVKYRHLQLGDSARVSHREMTWYGFNLDTTRFYLDALCVSSYHSALIFLKRPIHINDICFPCLIFSHHLRTVFFSFQCNHLSNFPCLPLFQLTLCNSVKLEIGYCEEGPFSSLAWEELSPTYVLVFRLLIRDHSRFHSCCLCH